jgi:hypothetical protein
MRSIGTLNLGLLKKSPAEDDLKLELRTTKIKVL